MAALVFCVCGALYDLCEFTDAFRRCNGDYRATLKYLQYKNRLRLFQLYRSEFWLNYRQRQRMLAGIAAAKKSAAKQDSGAVTSNSDQVQDFDVMSRRAGGGGGIDFAAIEASAEAFEAIDAFAINSRASCEDFLQMERQNAGFRENYYNDDEIEIIDGFEDDTDLHEDGEEDPIYHNGSLGKLCEGISFTVRGRTLRHCERFSINFIVENQTRDIALHINPRLPQNYIVRNSKVRNAWGREEVASALPFSLRRGAPFAIQVLFTDECYMISVNGYHFCKFYHRLPYDSVKTLEVKGEIEDVDVESRMVDRYPECLLDTVPKKVRIGRSLWSTYNVNADTVDDARLAEIDDKVATQWNVVRAPNGLEYNEPTIKRLSEIKLPYYGNIPPQSFQLGHELKVEGRVKLLPQSFYINLQSGHSCWPHPIIALHLNPRFTKQSSGAIGRATVIRNAWLDGAWSDEERSDLETTFRPGKPFSLSIKHGNDSFEIYVNQQLLTEFRFRVPTSTIDTIYIQGDIKLFDVALEKNSSLQKLMSLDDYAMDAVTSVNG